MAQANIYIRFPVININTRRQKLAIFSSSLDFYTIEGKGKVFYQPLFETAA